MLVSFLFEAKSLCIASFRDCGVGIASSDVHCVVWTHRRIYTWGTNRGQLGHREEVVEQPRAIVNQKYLRDEADILQVMFLL